MKIVLVVLLIGLAGCSGVSSLPSFEHCQKVSYSREGPDIKISAECKASFGGTEWLK